MSDLAGKTALVTGASRGIGRACALALAAAGADIAVNYHVREEAAQETCDLVERLGRRALSVRADVSRGADVARMVETVERELGPVGVLVNNAGISQRAPWDQIPEADWDETLAVNLKSVFLVIQAILPGMRAHRWGRIINMSSGAVQTGGVIGPHYTASKAGIIGLTHSYASLLVKEGITVNAVAPSLIETDMVTNDLQVAPELIPLGRFGTTEEVARVVAMLAENAYITGQTIYLNGGRFMS
jgi:3-oxoacyl-[acyl-carrier protein] reductase